MFRNPLFLCAILLLAYSAGLWGASIPLTGDQKVYLSVALEMFEKKQWIIPSLFGEPNFLKPPLQYWATILGWKVFGISVFGALIPSVLALISSAFLTFQIAKKINVKEPAVAAVLFASSFGSMTYGSTAQMEIWIVFFLLGAWLAVLYSQIFLAFILVGIMAWVKGPLYPVLWTVSFLVWDRKAIRSKNFWAALVFGAVVGLSWYFLAAQTHQKEMFQQFFYTENLGKMNTKQGSIMGLWSEFIFSLFPWVILFFIACTQGSTREQWKKNQRFYLSFSIVSAIFFTVFPYRVNSYLYFITPVVALMTAEMDLKFLPQMRSTVIAIYSLIFLFLALFLFRLFQGNWIGTEIFVAAILVFFLFVMGLTRGEWRYITFGSLILVNLVRVSAVQIGEKDTAGLKDAIQQRPGDYAYFIDSKDIWHEFGLMSSVVGFPLQRIYGAKEVDIFLAAKGSVIFQEDQPIPSSPNFHCTEWRRLKRRSKFPIQRFLRDGIPWGDSEITRVEHICSIGQ